MATFKAFFKLGVAVSAPLAFALPGHAIETCRDGSMGSYTAADIKAPGFTCKLGDKIYYDFDFNGVPSGSFVMTNPMPNFHTFQGQALGLGPGSSITYAYKVAIDAMMAPTSRMLEYATSTSVTNLGGGVTSNKSLEDAFTAMSAVNSANGMNSNPFTYTPPVSGPLAFVSEINVTNGLLTQFTDTLTQTVVTPPVPGPLPILGAAIAFGSSRQLRNRIRKLS